MKLKHFFPPVPMSPCPLCDAEEQPHHHIAPAIKDFFTYPEIYQYIQGGVGSAKTTGAAALFTFLILAVPHNEGIIFRKDFGLNYKSAWKAFQNCVRQLVAYGYIPEPKAEVKKQGEYTKYTFHNQSVVYAGQTKNISEFMGPEYGVIWIDDAMESPTTVLLGEGTVGGLQSRLRSPYATYARYKGATVDMRRFLITTNPPPGVSDWWRIFGKTPGVRAFSYDGTLIKYRHTQLTTAHNPFLPYDYIATLSANHTADEIARILQGKSVVYYGGKGVYQGYFSPSHHVASFLYDVSQPLLTAWDFGSQHPSIVFLQIRQCPFGTNHIIALSEIADLYGVTVWELYERGYLHHLNTLYGDHDNDLLFHACDIAGFKKTDSNKDKRGPALILQEEKGMIFTRRRFDLDYSIDFMRKALQSRCKCGFSEILIDRSCEMLCEAYGGGYHFPRKRDGSYTSKPAEDHTYEDIADAHRYGVENFLRFGIPYRSVATPPMKTSDFMHSMPQAWMEGYDAAAQSLIEVY